MRLRWFLLAMLAASIVAWGEDGPTTYVLPEGVEYEEAGRHVARSLTKEEAAMFPQTELSPLARVRTYAGQWVPFFLCSGPSLLAASSHTRLGQFDAHAAIITGLATAAQANLLVYAATDDSASSLLLLRPGEADARPIADSAHLEDDVWFSAPLSLSPNKRWLLANTRTGRRRYVRARFLSSSDAIAPPPLPEGAGVWLIDCTQQHEPALVWRDSQLESCQWSPSGRFAACSMVRLGTPERYVGVLDADKGTTRSVREGQGPSIWSMDEADVRILRTTDGGTSFVVYELATGRTSEVLASVPPAALEAGAAWSCDGRQVAWASGQALREGVRMMSVDGLHRSVPCPSGVARLLGWSHDGELLAYIDRADVMHVCVGLRSQGACDALLAVMPPAPFGVSGDARTGFGTRTVSSPVRVHSAASVLSGWTLRDGAPCLVYVDEGACGDQEMWQLQYARMGLSDLGVAKVEEIRSRIIDETCRINLMAVVYALQRYAEDHSGRLPGHSSGSALAEEIGAYLDTPSRLGSAYAPREMRVRLCSAGHNLYELEQLLRSHSVEHLELVELEGDDGLTFVAVGEVRPPDPGDPQAGEIRYVVRTRVR